jgi:hypothetical protein
MKLAPNSQPIRHASRHRRGFPADNMMVNSGGISTCSAITFTPPSEMSVTVQSRGNEPVPTWIFAKLLHTRRSLLRLFANTLIPFALLDNGSSNIPAAFKEELLESA